MNQSGPRFREIFFEVYENLPRQGPGNRACAARALGLCRDLPQSSAILDLGCGVGGQTLQLAELVPSDFYTPMKTRIAALRGKYAGDAEVAAILDQLAEEPEMHRRHSGFYAYEYFVARRPLQSRGPR